MFVVCSSSCNSCSVKETYQQIGSKHKNIYTFSASPKQYANFKGPAVILQLCFFHYISKVGLNNLTSTYKIPPSSQRRKPAVNKSTQGDLLLQGEGYTKLQCFMMSLLQHMVFSLLWCHCDIIACRIWFIAPSMPFHMNITLMIYSKSIYFDRFLGMRFSQ